MKKMSSSDSDLSEKEGKTKIMGQEPETKVPKDIGEYVDFENIEEEKTQ